ncbi:MAG: hypothetical protein HZY76_00065 [Anaerolineae bacterium]|nr:MAG: hypothetical protein HZY76_00065 [Anaerolineae bacterium]
MDCDYVATGETAAAVKEDAFAHAAVAHAAILKSMSQDQLAERPGRSKPTSGRLNANPRRQRCAGAANRRLGFELNERYGIRQREETTMNLTSIWSALEASSELEELASLASQLRDGLR